MSVQTGDRRMDRFQPGVPLLTAPDVAIGQANTAQQREGQEPVTASRPRGHTGPRHTPRPRSRARRPCRGLENCRLKASPHTHLTISLKSRAQTASRLLAGRKEGREERSGAEQRSGRGAAIRAGSPGCARIAEFLRRGCARRGPGAARAAGERDAGAPGALGTHGQRRARSLPLLGTQKGEGEERRGVGIGPFVSSLHGKPRPGPPSRFPPCLPSPRPRPEAALEGVGPREEGEVYVLVCREGESLAGCGLSNQDKKLAGLREVQRHIIKDKSQLILAQG
ncbi:uncharacterized protein LOC141728492 [Zonotrichia albicollis]|uniref:uncharacterized protein LOC141728492 n=1 Tax=Zonotrichia albicollis TaxID=44394 RepID=UPI003D80C426